MLNLPPPVRIFIAREPADMRKSFDGISGLVIDAIEQDPQSGHVFAFFNKRRTIAKLLVWDTSGYWLHCKRLEHGHFSVFDRVSSSASSFEIPSTDLMLLLEGIDLRGSTRRVTHEEMWNRRIRS